MTAPERDQEEDEEQAPDTPRSEVPSRRHRHISHVAPSPSFALSREGLDHVPVDRVSSGTLPDDVRAYLWDVVAMFLFTPNAGFDVWTGGISGRPAVQRVWAAAPLHGNAEAVPEDVAELVEGWFSLAEACEIFAFAQSVHDNLELPSRARFAASANVALERASSDHRFVMQKLVPIAARADIIAVERALTTCSASGFDVTHAVLLDALGRLGAQPEPDFRGAIQEAVRAVEEAAFMLTGERHLTLEEALDDLKEKGLVDGALEAAHRGLFGYASASSRKTTADDARLILVMCAGFISHLCQFKR